MVVRLCIHRASNTIGGNCIEIVAANGDRLLLDAGRPLDAPEGVPTTIPVGLDISGRVKGILLSHAHADHTGLLESLPADWPVYCGEATQALLQLSAITGSKKVSQKCNTWIDKKKFAVGPFTITPFLIDHSAFDAYALQIEVDGKKLFYSGDFRAHGRKLSLTKKLISCPPKDVDVLIMEGTNLPPPGIEKKPTVSEAELEKKFVQLFSSTKGRVFVSWSATNIDRTVTLYRACKQTKRILVPDLYSMLVLMRLKEFANIPQPEWEDKIMKAVVTNKMLSLMGRIGEPNLVEYLKQHRSAISAKMLASTPERWVIMVRDSLVDDYAAKGVIPDKNDAWVWSLWSGYLEKDSTQKMRTFFNPCFRTHIHTSGHASPEDLECFAKALKPRILIPVHGEAWADYADIFENMLELTDGKWITVN